MSPFIAGCYGKLPFHGDFIRHRAALPEVDALDEWIQSGILALRQAAGTGWEAAFDAAPPLRFLYAPKGAARVLGGVLAPSRDRAGRRFPFLVFAGPLEARAAAGEPTQLPALLSSFMDRAEDLALRGWNGLDLKALPARVDALASPAPEAVAARTACAEFASTTTAGAFWSALFGAADDPRRFLLLENLAETLAGRAVPRFVLRFPPSGGETAVAFWLETARRLSRGGVELPVLAAWSSRGASLIYDALLSKYFLPVFQPDRDSETLFRLAGETLPDEARLRRARDRWSPLLEDPALPLASLLLRMGEARLQ